MTSKKAANPVKNSFRRGMTGNLAMRHGRFFDDFEPGQTFSHWPGRTVTEADDIWFSLLTQNQNPLHIDAHYRRQPGSALQAAGEWDARFRNRRRADRGRYIVERHRKSGLRAGDARGPRFSRRFHIHGEHDIVGSANFA